MKHFPSDRDAAPVAPVEFSVDFVREQPEGPPTVETHEFAARPQMAYGDVLGLVANENDPKAIGFLDRLIRRALVNDDGVPEKWRPYVHEGHFTAPGGGHTPADQLPKFELHAAGSSRRRWVELIGSDEVAVSMKQISAVMEFLTEEASEGRPTSKSSP